MRQKQTFKYETTKPNIDQYWPLFESTGWNDFYKFTKEDLDSALEARS